MVMIDVKINALVYRNLNDMGISPQKLGEVLIDSWYSDPLNNVNLLCNIDLLQDRIAKLKAEIEQVDKKYELLQKLEKELEVQESLAGVSRAAGKAFTDLQYLNKRIVYYKFDVGTIMKKHGDIIKRIKEYDPNFDIDAHVERQKIIRIGR